jgi:hypothetical protein
MCGDCMAVQIKIDLGNLDITTDLVNFDEIDEDLERFQQDEIVSEALVKVGMQAGARQQSLVCCEDKGTSPHGQRSPTKNRENDAGVATESWQSQDVILQDREVR